MIIWFAAMAALAQADAPPPQAKIAIVGANVLPMSGIEQLRDQTVLVDGDRIVPQGDAGVGGRGGEETAPAQLTATQ